MFPFLLFTHLTMMLLSAGNGNGHPGDCPHWFDRGKLGRFGYPFAKVERQDCGIWPIHGCDDIHNPNAVQSVLLEIGQKSFEVRKFEMEWLTTTLYFADEDLSNLLQSDSCKSFSHSITLPPNSPLGYFYIKNNVTLFKCNRTLKVNTPKTFLKNTSCLYDILFGPPNSDDASMRSLAACSMVQLPMNGFAISANPFAFITAEVPILFQPSDECFQCVHDEGQCRLHSQGKFYCAKRKDKSLAWKRGLALGLGVGPWIIIIFGLIHMLRRCKRKYGRTHANLQSRNTGSEPDTETDRIFFGVPVFSYKELQEATNNFDPTKKLGDGGFGSVYYGKLTDGREVAVKYLFEHNYRRLEQFMNEIEILTRLRHRNLVSLYGCTSRHSRELLLVYEYVPRGTVASHVRGDFGRAGLLTWPVRMRIAIETAAALAYLHASDIIHRDVKTNNILLDINFSVKVADFGLSRLFPNDVSHISTAPQGTPGYLDPEYFQCYQLTDKSDVYSFGVVLIELISSMPAVDAARERDEINLANLALKKIRNGALGELVDPSLGFESDSEVKRMVTSVAELAFQCVQGDKELRPSMDQVLQALNKIENANYEVSDRADDGAGTLHGECIIF